MFKKIDVYIAKKFLITFIVSLFLFVLISVVIDISEKMEDFVKTGLSPFEIFTQYYLGFIPHILAILYPIFVFISVIFFTSKMANKSEIIAIYASGVSYYRWLLTYVFMGVFFGIILWIFSNYIVPIANITRSDFEARYIDANSAYLNLTKPKNHLYFKLDSHTYCGLKNYYSKDKRGDLFFVNELKDNYLIFNLRSQNIIYDTTNHSWKLQNALERNVFNLGEEIKRFNTLEKKFSFKPADLELDLYTKDKLITPKLKQSIFIEQRRGSPKVKILIMEYYRRQTTPILTLLLVILGAIISGRKIRGGNGISLSIGISFSAGFIILEKFSTIFATKGNLPPILAAYFPIILFIFIIIFYLYREIKT